MKKFTMVLSIALFTCAFTYAGVNCDSCNGEHATDGKMPMLGVYKVYSVLSKNLSLPYQVK